MDKSIKKRRAEISAENDDSFAALFAAAGKSALIAAITAILLLLVFCIIAYSQADPDKFVLPLSYAALAVTAFVCGFSASRTAKNRILPTALVSAAIFIVVMMIASLITGGETGFMLSLAVYAGFALLSVLGAVAGARKNSKPHRKHK